MSRSWITTEPAPLYPSPAPSCPYRSPATTHTAYVMADSGDFTWYARSLGKSCGCAGLDDAELVPSDGSAVAAAKQSSATRRWVVRNLTWLAISKMLYRSQRAYNHTYKHTRTPYPYKYLRKTGRYFLRLIKSPVPL